MILCGIGDEAGNRLESQISAVQSLGWRHLELRNVELAGYPKANLHEIPDTAFEEVVQHLSESQIQVIGLGSTIMNWAKKVSDPWNVTLAEINRAIPRMHRLGTRLVRIMSFKPDEGTDELPTEVIRRVAEVTARFRDEGLQVVHENCMNHGGMSPRHGVQLLDAIPDLAWVFDTANPVFNADRSRPKPWPQQDPWEFWLAVRDRVQHIHVKDARWNPAKNDADYTWPGEGDGAVVRILTDAAQRGYRGGVSIEPHMVAVFHGPGTSATDEALRTNFIEYGRRLETIVRAAGRLGATSP